MARANVYTIWVISALFIAQSFPKWFVHFWMTFCKNSISISCQIIFVNKHIGSIRVQVPLNMRYSIYTFTMR